MRVKYDVVNHALRDQLDVQINAGDPEHAGPGQLHVVSVQQTLAFVGVMTERLMTYALGRGFGYADMPAVRKIVRSASGQNYRFSALVLGIAGSPAFQMKTKKPAIAAVAANREDKRP